MSKGKTVLRGSSKMITQAIVYTPLPERHLVYEQIGRLVAEGARLEHRLDFIIWDLSGIDHQRGACITGHLLGATPRFKAIISLCTQRRLDKKLIDRAISLMRKSFDIVEGRNRTVHDPWYMESDAKTPAQWRSMPFKTLEFGIMDVDAKKIEKTIGEYRALTQKVADLQKEILAALQSSLEKSQ
jgi:hypothetical protein